MLEFHFDAKRTGNFVEVTVRENHRNAGKVVLSKKGWDDLKDRLDAYSPNDSKVFLTTVEGD